MKKLAGGVYDKLKTKRGFYMIYVIIVIAIIESCKKFV